jgi:hypothetical protein
MIGESFGGRPRFLGNEPPDEEDETEGKDSAEAPDPSDEEILRFLGGRPRRFIVEPEMESEFEDADLRLLG